MLTGDGHAKLLDFGVRKGVHPAARVPDGAVHQPRIRVHARPRGPDRAAEVFTTMTWQTSLSRRSRGHRSLALLEMYRGRFSRAVDQLREAILISQAHGYGASELRDRLFLASAYDARGMRRAALDEVAAADRLAAGMTVEPT
jgi:hypothetical protein